MILSRIIAIWLSTSFTSFTLVASDWNFRQHQYKRFDALLRFDKYDSTIRPQDDEKPIIIRVKMVVTDIIPNEDSLNTMFKFTINLKQQWIDVRLQLNSTPYFKYITLNGEENVKRIWEPHSYFENEVSGKIHNVIQSNMFAKWHPNGEIQHSTRLTLNVFCEKNIESFPFQHFMCSIPMTSIHSSLKDVIFVWDINDPIVMQKDLRIAYFDLKNYFSDYCVGNSSLGQFSCVRMNFVFRRQIGHYMKRIFIPYIMAVAFSWTSFWINHKLASIRITIGIISIWATSDVTSWSQITFRPPQNYTAIFVWETVCFVFLIFAFLEFVLVYATAQHRTGKKLDNKGNTKNECIDEISRLAFPITFIGFNAIYWTLYGVNYLKGIL